MASKKQEKRNLRRNMARHSSKMGLPPGTLIHLGDKKTDHPRVTLVEFGPDNLKETEFSDVNGARDYKATEPVLWLNVYGLHEPAVLEEIGKRFHLHPLVLEDILNTDQRPKVDDYGDYLFLVARFFEYDEATATVNSEQVSIVLGKNFVLSFQERPTGNFTPVRDRLRHSQGQIRRQGADYLAYALLDVIVDKYFVVIEQIGDRTEQLEDDLISNVNPSLLHTLHQLKRETLTVRRAVWPLREVLNQLTRTDVRFFQPATQPYLRDVYDHTVHLIESLEAVRDLIAGMLDIYLSAISNRLNQEVRALTVVAIIFMPATLISGIFGMNFHVMPLLDNGSGFYIALGIMLTIATSIGLVFWRRRWIG